MYATLILVFTWYKDVATWLNQNHFGDSKVQNLSEIQGLDSELKPNPVPSTQNESQINYKPELQN